MTTRLLWALPLLFLACACEQTSKATFEVQVMNIGTTPICIGLTKTGKPAEDGWAAPSDVPPQFWDRHWGTLIRPGETKVLGPQTGHFAQDVIATLRVYAGNPTVTDLQAYSHGDPDRLDIPLWPGRSSFVINNPRGGRLTASTPQDFESLSLPPLRPSTRPTTQPR